MDHQAFIRTIFKIIEHITKSELQNTSKHLICNYFIESLTEDFPGKARDVIKRYTQEDIPSLEAVRSKAKTEKLDALDHLVLRMEYTASKIRK